MKIKDINTSVANICGVNQTKASRALKKAELNRENCENIIGAAGRRKIIYKEYPSASKIRSKCLEKDIFHDEFSSI